MKRIYIYFLPLVLLLNACAKKTELLFNGTVDQRLQAALSRDSSILVNSTYGWKAVLSPGNGEGAYFFHMQFASDGAVTMIADVDTATAVRTHTGTYRLKAMQLPSLIFDTYTYIHKLSDPDPAVAGGASGKGKNADFEFSFISVKEDSVLLKGNVNGSSCLLVRASQSERDAYTGGALRQLINTTADFCAANPYLLLHFPDGRDMPFGLSIKNKMVVMQYVDEHNSMISLKSNFHFTQDSLCLTAPVSYKGSSFQGIYWDNVANKCYVKLNNQRTDLQTIPAIPKLPLTPALYTQILDPYAAIVIDPAELDGLPASFMVIINDCLTKMAATGREVNKIELLFPVAGQAQLKFSYPTATGATFSVCIYDMSIDSNGLASFVVKTAIATTAVRNAVKLFTDYLAASKFSFAYVASTANTKKLGGLFHPTNATSYFFGELK